MTSLRSTDFTIFPEEIDKIFLDLVGKTDTRSAQRDVLPVDKLMNAIYDAVKAVMIYMMERGLKNSRRFIVDMLAARDTDKDGFLEYQQFEDMLVEDLQVNFGQNLFDKIIIQEFMDPGKRHNKIKNDIIKMYLGEGEVTSIMDMVPQQENWHLKN